MCERERGMENKRANVQRRENKREVEMTLMHVCPEHEVQRKLPGPLFSHGTASRSKATAAYGAHFHFKFCLFYLLLMFPHSDML